MSAPLRPPKPVSVRGGTGGIEAFADELTELAVRLGAVALDVAGAVASLHLVGADPGLVESGVLDPVGAARFEAALFAALDGPHGMAWIAVRCGLLDAALRAAAVAYVAADTVETDVREVIAALGHVGRRCARPSIPHFAPTTSPDCRRCLPMIPSCSRS